MEAANAYLRDVDLSQHNAAFRRAPRETATAFVPLGAVDVDDILCQEDERLVAPDNTIVVDGQLFQIERQAGRPSFAGLRVLVRHHLDGRVTITRPPTVSLRYTIITREPTPPPALPRPLPRRRRQTGLGRWPTADQLWPNLV